MAVLPPSVAFSYIYRNFFGLQRKKTSNVNRILVIGQTRQTDLLGYVQQARPGSGLQRP